MTDEFDDSPQGDSMMSPPLEPIESFEAKITPDIELSEASTQPYRVEVVKNPYEPEEHPSSSQSEGSSSSSSSSSSDSSDSEMTEEKPKAPVEVTVPEYITKLYLRPETLKSFIESPDASKMIALLKVRPS
jgi:hypothetical protein